MRRNFFYLILLLSSHTNFCLGQGPNNYKAIHSGVPWFDDQGKTVSAHGANIIKERGRYYLFGEAHTDTSNAFAGFNCYSSADLYNWKFESVALPLQASGKLGPNRVGERPKVMKSPTTGEFVMFMHVDTLGYVDQFVGYATSKKITGPYVFKGPLLYQGKPIKKWDMGAFQDSDGSGYVLLHGGDIYRLNEKYTMAVEQVSKSFTTGFESPALFRKDSVYYFLGSNLTGWERNDNYYYTAAALKGPWIKRGLLAPEGTLTWNSQTSFVFPITGSKETTFLFMGDRWSFPRQASAATYVWQPLRVSGHSVSLPVYQDAWQINTGTGRASSQTIRGMNIAGRDKRITYSGNWQQDTFAVMSSDKKGAYFSAKFTGKQIAMYGLARPDGGYANISIRNSRGKTMLHSTVDLYCKYPVTTLKFLSPVFPKDTYTITVSVVGENWYWVDKRKNRSGSSGFVVSLDRIVVTE